MSLKLSVGHYISVPELPKPVLGRSDMKVDMHKIGYAHAHTIDIEVLDSPGDASTQKVTLHGVYQGLIFLLTHRVIGMGWVGETSMTPTMAHGAATRSSCGPAGCAWSWTLPMVATFVLPSRREFGGDRTTKRILTSSKIHWFRHSCIGNLGFDLVWARYS